MQGLRFSFRLARRDWYLAGGASCARFCDGWVHHTNNKTVRGARTCMMWLKMSNARSRGMTERWPAQLTVNMAFSMRPLLAAELMRRWLWLKVSLGAFPGCLSEWEAGMDPGPALAWAGLNVLLNFLPSEDHRRAFPLDVMGPSFSNCSLSWMLECSLFSG